MYPNQGSYGNQYTGSAPPYPGQQQPFGAGYPQAPQQPFGAGNAQMPMPGLPSYPPQQQGYPSMNQPGYPQAPQQPFGAGYVQMPMPGQPSYPPQQPGFSPQQSGYPSQQPGYPPQQPGFPPQQPGYPPQQPSAYPPQQQTGYPPAGYPQLPGQEPMLPQQQFNSYQNAAPQQPQHAPPPQQQTYGQPAYGQPAYGQQPVGQQTQKGRPTLVPAPNFNASNDAAALRKAMKGFGTNEDAIIEVLCRRTNAQRVEIARIYKTAYGKDLIDDIRSETSGNFENTLIALLIPMHELYAKELFEAMYGEGTDEDVLIEVMCSMSNYEIRAIGMQFQRMYGKNLEKELRSDTSGNFKRLMTSLSCAARDESMVTDVNQAKIDAQELKRAGVDKWGTDESAFNRVLCLRNYEQIKLIAQEYQKLTGNTLEKDIKREFSGDIEDGLLAILRVAQNRHEFFAQRLHKSMAGIGTTDKSLIRLIVTRCEIDMVDIKEAFMRKYGKTLKSFIKGDTSGHYKHALYALTGENRS